MSEWVMSVLKSGHVMTEVSKAWRKVTVTLAPARGVRLSLVVSGVLWLLLIYLLVTVL